MNHSSFIWWVVYLLVNKYYSSIIIIIIVIMWILPHTQKLSGYWAMHDVTLANQAVILIGL